MVKIENIWLGKKWFPGWQARIYKPFIKYINIYLRDILRCIFRWKMFKNVQDDNVELFSFDPNIDTIGETGHNIKLWQDTFLFNYQV